MGREVRATDKMCSVCLQGDLKACACPWHLPFGKWPMAQLATLKALVGPGPHKGS